MFLTTLMALMLQSSQFHPLLNQFHCPARLWRGKGSEKAELPSSVHANPTFTVHRCSSLRLQICVTEEWLNPIHSPQQKQETKVDLVNVPLSSQTLATELLVNIHSVVRPSLQSYWLIHTVVRPLLQSYWLIHTQ